MTKKKKQKKRSTKRKRREPIHPQPKPPKKRRFKEKSIKEEESEESLRAKEKATYTGVFSLTKYIQRTQVHRRLFHQEEMVAAMISLANLSENKQQEIVSLIESLVAVAEAQGEEIESFEATVFLGNSKEEIRRIGARLNSLGGNEAMLLAHHTVSLVHHIWGRELSLVFNGIGSWFD